MHPRFDLVLGQSRQFDRRVAVAVERAPDNRLGVGILFGNDRLSDVLRQLAADARDAVTHILRRDVNIARKIELDADRADTFTALA